MQYALCHAAPGAKVFPRQWPVQARARRLTCARYRKRERTVRRTYARFGVSSSTVADRTRTRPGKRRREGREGKKQQRAAGWCLLGSNVDRTPFATLPSYPAFRRTSHDTRNSHSDHVNLLRSNDVPGTSRIFRPEIATFPQFQVYTWISKAANKFY